jgi:hypothetical protein
MGGGVSLNTVEGDNGEASSLGTLVYPDISLDAWPGRAPEECNLPDRFRLRLGHESLDFLDENNVPLVQFPYQIIISWGHTAATFRFTIPKKGAAFVGSMDSMVSVCVRTIPGVAPSIDKMIMKTVLKLMDDMKNMSTVTKEELHMLKRTLLVPQPVPKPLSRPASPDAGDYPATPQITAKPSPSDAPSQADEFSDTDMSNAELREDWFVTVTQFCVSRSFLAKQAMELVQFAGPLAPFERIDLAEMLYNRIFNKDSFQLVVNAFEDRGERENLTHRLKLKGFVTDSQLIE